MRIRYPELAFYVDGIFHGNAGRRSCEVRNPADESVLGLLPWTEPDEVDGAVAGYAYAGAFRERPAYRFTVEDSIYIAPDMHRRGIGRALLTRLLAEAEAAGFRQMIAVIGDSGQAASIAVHRACGFHDVGVFEAVGFKFGRWLDTVQMQRPLGKGALTAP